MGNSQQFINANLYPKKASTETISGLWTHKNATNDIAGLVADVTDTTGFAHIQDFKKNGSPFMYVGTIFGFNGFINELNNPFFFGNGDALNFYLMNPIGANHTISVNGYNYILYTTALDLQGKNLATTGSFTDGTTPIVSGHTHQGTGNTGAIIPHVTVDNGRALDAVYSNSLATSIMVHGTVECIMKNFGDEAYIECFTDTSNPPVTLQSKVGGSWRSASSLADQQDFYHQFFFIVQPGHKWTITSTQVGGGTTTLLVLKETPL